jgi:hypothetical protein
VVHNQLDGSLSRRDREIIEVFPDYAAARLLGARRRYEASWRVLFDQVADIRQAGAETQRQDKEVTSMSYVGEYCLGTDT